MMRPQRRPSCWAGLLGPLAAVLVCAAAGAVDDDVVGESDPAAGVRQPNLIDLGANFDANLFEQQGNGWVLRNGPVPDAEVRPASPALERGRDMGRRRIERIAASCTMTEDQRRRLLLAVESDARRFAAEVDAVRGKYVGRRVDLNDQAGQKEWHAFQQDVATCRERLRSVFDRGALFETVLSSVLDERQLACLAAENAARRSFHWRAMVLEAMTKIDETLGLDQRQHDLIVTDLLAHEPLLRLDEQSLGRGDTNMRRHLVLMVMASLDGKPIKAAVSDRQWQSLSVMMNQGRALRSALEQQGMLEPSR